ncbi:hypothetical protein K1719_033836 [Acacia pycnantha]|nr:hypothetical protein K1719_033836 [Acacia pycnantha]
MVSWLSTRLLNICIASMCKARQLVKAEVALIDGIRLGVLPDVVTYNTLIDAYCRFVSIDDGYYVLHRMREAGIKPDVISYNSLIAGAARKCLLSRSLDLFEEMIQMGIHPDLRSYNILMDCLFKLGKPDEANRVFRDIILSDLHPSKATFNILIDGLCKNGYASREVYHFVKALTVNRMVLQPSELFERFLTVVDLSLNPFLPAYRAFPMA